MCTSVGDEKTDAVRRSDSNADYSTTAGPMRYPSLSDAMSMEKRYFTSDFTIRS
jgi:hypothetical protein